MQKHGGVYDPCTTEITDVKIYPWLMVTSSLLFFSFVLGIGTRMSCPNYEVVWDLTGPLLNPPGSNLGQGPTQP